MPQLYEEVNTTDWSVVSKRYQEHLHDFKYNNGNSKFAQHLTDNKHSFGPIDKVIKILHTIKKGAMMDTIEKYHIYKTTQLEGANQ